ncbi:cation:proton antiporter [Clostridium vincentii]|uniref:Potassium/proton antiporter n=1 Tax=Clostridium vincentii TaxID=52704 RepID=A0A2T0B787_9CLOT|nr:potassium/proton antiporter [Clostridium vincentii]
MNRLELNIYTNLALALFLALLSSKIMKKLHLPNVTGYLIIGLIAGPYCLKILSVEVIEQFLIIPEIALGFIAFSIGSEFKLSYLKKVGKSPVIIAIAEALGAVLVVDIALIITGHDIAFSLVLGAIAAATAPAATLMVVRQYKAKGPVTRTLLPVVAIDDALALMLYGISIAIAKAIDSHGTVPLASSLFNPIIEIVGALIFGAILGIILKFLVKLYTGRGNRLTSCIAMILFCIGVSNLLGVSALLACMAMSSVFVNISNISITIYEQVDRLTPPIFMLFFFISGAELDMSILPSVGVIGAIYVIFRVVGKVGGAALGARIAHSEPVVQKYLGFTLIPQAGVAIGLATLAMAVVPDYGSEIRAIILSATVIYELIGPIVAKTVLKKAGEIEDSL